MLRQKGRRAVLPRRSVLTRGAALLLGAGVLIAVTGCQPDVGATGSRSTGDTTQAATADSFGAPATATIDDGQGNTATLSVSVGRPMSAGDSPEAQACAIRLTDGGVSAAAAVPIRIAGTVTSGSPIDYVVHLGNLLALGSTDGTVTMPGAAFWAVRYTDTPWECDGVMSGGPIEATVKWVSAGPGQANSWTAWLVVPAARTSADPTGAQTLGALVLQPLVQLGTQTGVPQFDPSSDSVVQCDASDPALGLVPYVALDASVATDHGCSSHVEGAAQLARDKFCQAAIPVTDTGRTVGNVTTYSPQASLYAVCDGALSSPGITMTQAMKCAFIGLAASYAGEQAPDLNSLDSLCSTDDVVRALADGSWVKAGGQQACNWFADVFSEQAGAWAAAEVAATVADPVAIAIGVVAAGALKAGLGQACGGDLLKDAQALGERLESKHLGDVAHDVVAKGRCMRYDAKPIFPKDGWSAVPCTGN